MTPVVVWPVFVMVGGGGAENVGKCSSWSTADIQCILTEQSEHLFANFKCIYQ